MSADGNNRTFSLSERAFIKDQANLRLGRFAEPKLRALIPQIDAIDLDLVRNSIWRPVVIFRKARDGLTILLKRGNNPRNSEFMTQIEQFKAFYNTTFVIDFGDNIPLRYEPFEGLNIPVFSKSRAVGSDAPIILWTHNADRRHREDGLAGRYERVAWRDKSPELVWRGGPRGSLLLNNGYHLSAYDLFRHLTGEFDANLDVIVGTFGDRDFRDIVDDNLGRFAAVSRYGETHDIRFVTSGLDSSESYVAFLEKRGYRFGNTMAVNKINRCKYHLVLEGNDAGTQINWALSSGSVILMPPRQFHSATTLELKEWVHYVPLRSDLLDLPDRLDWCRSNDGECRAIAENAHAYVARFRPAVEDEINRRVLALYRSRPLIARMRNALSSG